MENGTRQGAGRSKERRIDMKYTKTQRERIIEEIKGKVILSLEYDEQGEYWIMNLAQGDNQVEMSFRFMAELV